MKKFAAVALILVLLAFFVAYSVSLPGKNHTATVVSGTKSSAVAANVTKNASSKTAVSKSASSAASFAALEKLDGKKRGWGQGTQVDKDNRPVSCMDFQNRYGKYGAVFIRENTPKIYLTFDEGYENGYTARILDTLKEKKVSAVFFVTWDYAKRNHDLVQRMIDEGNVVGNHSYHHPSMPTLSLSKASSEITDMHAYVRDNFHYTMTLFRPPMGEFSERTLALTQSLGYKTVFWSFAYVDWNPKQQIGAEKASSKIVSGLHNGAVYLLHAVSKDNADILGSFIDTARGKGYEFTKMS